MSMEGRRGDIQPVTAGAHSPRRADGAPAAWCGASRGQRRPVQDLGTGQAQKGQTITKGVTIDAPRSSRKYISTTTARVQGSPFLEKRGRAEARAAACSPVFAGPEGATGVGEKGGGRPQVGCNGARHRRDRSSQTP